MVTKKFFNRILQTSILSKFQHFDISSCSNLINLLATLLASFVQTYIMYV